MVHLRDPFEARQAFVTGKGPKFSGCCGDGCDVAHKDENEKDDHEDEGYRVRACIFEEDKVGGFRGEGSF